MKHILELVHVIRVYGYFKRHHFLAEIIEREREEGVIILLDVCSKTKIQNQEQRWDNWCHWMKWGHLGLHIDFLGHCLSVKRFKLLGFPFFVYVYNIRILSNEGQVGDRQKRVCIYINKWTSKISTNHFISVQWECLVEYSGNLIRNLRDRLYFLFNMTANLQHNIWFLLEID